MMQWDWCFRRLLPTCRLLPVFRSSSLTSYVELSKRYKLGKLQTNCGRLSHSVPGCSGAVQKSQDLQRKISRGSIARCAHLPTFIAGYEESSMLRLRLRPFKEAVSADQAAGDLSDTGQLHRAALRHTHRIMQRHIADSVASTCALCSRERRCSALHFAGQYVPWQWLVQPSATVRRVAMSRSA